MKKHPNQVLLVAGLLLVMVFPTFVAAQQNLKLLNPTNQSVTINGPKTIITGGTDVALNNMPKGSVIKLTYSHTLVLAAPDSIWKITDREKRIEYAAIDHMPILKPDMRQYKMPVLDPLLKPGIGITIIPK